MIRQPIHTERMRESLEITLAFLPFAIPLTFIGHMIKSLPHFSLSDPQGLLVVAKSLAARGFMPMIGVGLG